MIGSAGARIQIGGLDGESAAATSPSSIMRGEFLHAAAFTIVNDL